MLNLPGFNDTALDPLMPDAWWYVDNTNYGGNVWIDRGKANKNIVGRLVSIVQGAGRGWTPATWGKGSGAMALNGTSDYVNIGSAHLNLSGTSPFSVSAWVFPSTLFNGNNMIVISDTNYSGGYQGWALWLIQTGTIWFNFDVNTIYAKTTATLPQSKWTHLTVTYDGTGATGITIYFNGISQALTTSGTAANVFNNNNMEIGNENGWSGSSYWQGSLDDIRIYKRLLNANEVKQIMSRSLEGIPGPKRWWQAFASAAAKINSRFFAFFNS